jgi:hypothetical protein
MRFDTPLSRRWTCDDHRVQKGRYLASQVERGSPSRLHRLLGTRGGALGSARSDLLPGCVYRCGIGHRAPHDNSGLHDRVRTSSPWQQPRRSVRLLERSGADATGRSRISFARYKGEAEKALPTRGFASVYIFRSAYIYPVTPRREPNFGYRLLRAIYPAFRLMFPYQVIRADDLARAMVDVAMRGTEGRQGVIFENRDIQAIVE